MTSRSRSARAKRSASSANRAAGSRSRRSPSCDWWSRPGRIAAGRLLFKGRDLMTLGERDMQRVRGADIALVFQEPMTALNPVFTVGDQIGETLIVHGLATRREARSRAIELLAAVRIPDAAARVSDYPASAVRRHAPARDDRHRARVQAVARDRRRADDRARRDDPGADSGSAARHAIGVRAVDPAHHARPRGRRGDGGPCRRDVRRTHRRNGTGARDLCVRRSIRTPGACWRRSPAARAVSD